jgi:dTDP-4-amino-4,6-dideoxygalactose transaminase
MAPYAPPAGALPATDEAARTHLAIPMSAALTEAQVGEVAAALRAAV